METLRRYTDILSLIDIIQHESLTFLKPDTWDDKNDVYAMSKYLEFTKSNTLLALCFTEQQQETFHHWNVFSGNSSGVCIVFDKNKLIESMNKHSNIKHGAVEYISSTDHLFDYYSAEQLPFIKRVGYNDEMEYRFIYESDEPRPFFEAKIDFSCIQKIEFSPSIPKILYSSALEVISKLPSIARQSIKIERSTLKNDAEWKCMIDTIAEPGTSLEDHIIKHVD